MTVRARILWLLLLVATIFVAGIVSMQAIEEEKLRQFAADWQRYWNAGVDGFLKAQGIPLNDMAEDLSAKAALTEAVVGGDTESLGTMIDEAELNSRGIHVAWIYRADGTFLFSHAHSASARSMAERPVPDSNVQSLFSRYKSPHFHVPWREPGTDDALRLIEVRGAIICPSFARGDPSRIDGYLLVGRMLGPEGLAEMPLLSPDDRIELRPPGEEPAAGPATTMSFSQPLTDWKARPIAQLVVTNKSSGMTQIEARGARMFTVLIGGSLALFTVLFLLLSRSIVTPLRGIIGGLHSGNLAPLEPLRTQNTEFGELARLIHAFVVQSSALVRETAEKTAAQEALRANEEMLRHSQKMEAVGRLAGGVAHDFNNLLTAIIGYADLLIRRLADDPKSQQNARLIHQAGEQAAGLTRQLLAFSRKQLLQPRVIDLNTVIRDLHQLLQRIIGEHIAIRTFPDAQRSCVKADPGQLEQVIVNLGVNARDAMPRGGGLVIRTQSVRLDAPDEALELPAGDFVVLAVTDNGEGMSAETKARIFEPFFTTKGPGKGTGLGLATVYGIVKQSNGGICVESEPGRGSTFRIYLPLAEPAIEGQGAPVPKSGIRMPAKSETVLVVEDEEIVRELICEVLRGHGYTILGADSGTSALALLRAHHGRIDLLISDVVMPEMDGATVAHRVRELAPAVRVLFVSGYSEKDMADQGLDDLSFEVLQKPFTPAALAAKVRDTLDAPAPV